MWKLLKECFGQHNLDNVEVLGYVSMGVNTFKWVGAGGYKVFTLELEMGPPSHFLRWSLVGMIGCYGRL